MSSPTLASGPARAPFEVHSVHFDFPGGQAIRLREHASHSFVGTDPEWLARPPRQELAAYVRGTQPSIRVVFSGSSAADGTYRISADGVPCPVEERSATLAFDPASGLSQPVDFRLLRPLPDQVGLHPVRFEWHGRDSAGSGPLLTAGTSDHRIGTTWRAMTPNPAQGLLGWVYRQLMEWTCQWCAGGADEKDVCDAIIASLPSSGLRYGVHRYDVRAMLQHGGGMCGGWYQMFQQMAHCQGVFVHRRCFLVDWRTLPTGEELWCALVVCSGGLNQPQPTEAASEFHDNDAVFPISAPVALTTSTVRRYRFWGMPGGLFQDGHCINFLDYQGRLFLYDACFGAGPVEVRSPLPPDDHSLHGGAQLSSFRAAYLDTAVDYMLGSAYNGGVLWQTVGVGPAATNGMTVRTAVIPDVVQGQPGVSFYWGG